MKRMLKRPAVLFAALAATAGFSVTSSARATCGVFANGNSSQCMAVSGGNVVPGAPIIQWDCTATPDQYWDIEPDGLGFYQIRNCVPDNGITLCLSAVNSLDGSQLELGSCNENYNPFSSWQISTIDYGPYSLSVLTDHWSNDVAAVSLGQGTNNGMNEGTGIIQWPNQAGLYSHLEQQWLYE